MIDCEAVIEAISAATTLEELQALFPELATALGVSHVVYHAVSVPSINNVRARPIFLLTYEEEWVNRYFAEHYLDIDPIVSSGLRAFLPLDWSDVPLPGGRVTDFFKDAGKHGIGRRGVTIPIRGPYGERALFTINARSSQRDWEAIRTRLMPQFHILGHFIHERAMRLGAARGEVLPQLSRRERECLQLAAAGKMHKRIAWELRLSESAVNLYVASARHKLGVATLAQAVAAALSMEIINYCPK